MKEERMREVAFVVGFNLATACAFARVAGVLVGATRSWVKRRSFDVVRLGPVEAITLLEPGVLALVAYVLLVDRRSASSASAADAATALAGGFVALTGLLLAVWTLLSWRQLFVGHGVLRGQRLVTGGAYAFVRHPVYLGGVLIWAGLSLCFLSLPAAAVTAFYVAPAYLLYIRSEEAMMLDCFGEEYRAYRRRVPMLLPRPRRQRSSSRGLARG
jgi:protein-S-isoprenylcysteine O-methyltransferase Ste14